MSKRSFIKATKPQPELNDNLPNPSDSGCFLLSVIALFAAAAYFLSQIN